MIESEHHALERVRRDLPALALALSGGVDSLTLAAFLGASGHAVTAFHAVSAAVPREATERARALCAQRGVPLEILDAGEMRDARYLENPLDRCFYCKSDLYRAIAARTDLLVVSGTNADDLADFRPGLRAAATFAVRHPFAEARMGKGEVRALGRALGLGALAELPAQPCLSSRVETGIAIDARVLAAIDEVERRAREMLGQNATIRCRVRARGAVIELDEDSLARLVDVDRARLVADAAALLRDVGLGRELVVERYRMGSTFLRVL